MLAFGAMLGAVTVVALNTEAIGMQRRREVALRKSVAALVDAEDLCYQTSARLHNVINLVTRSTRASLAVLTGTRVTAGAAAPTHGVLSAAVTW